MSAFNVSCMVSRQAITDKAPVRLLPLLQESTHRPIVMTSGEHSHSLYGAANQLSYPNSLWTLGGPGLEADYAGSGGFTLRKTSSNLRNLLVFLRTLLHTSVVAAEGENSVHEKAYYLQAYVATHGPAMLQSDSAEVVPADTLWKQLQACFDYVWDFAQRSRFFVQTRRDVPRLLQFTAIHEVAFDHLVGLADLAPRELFNGAFERASAMLDGGAKEDVLLAAHSFDSGLQGVGNFTTLCYYGESEAVQTGLGHVAQGIWTADTLYRYLEPYMQLRCAMDGLYAIDGRLQPLAYSSAVGNERGQRYAALVRSVSSKVTRAIKASHQE